MIKVMIVDDHKMVSEGLKKLIEFDENIEVVAEAPNGHECLVLLRSVKPDVILLDLNMPELDGLGTLKALNKKTARPKVLVLTVHNEIEYLIRALEMGVDGYILKDSDSAELVRAIRCVHEGEKFIQPSMIPLLNSKLIARDMDREKLASLSEREIEVLKLATLGNGNKEIADILCISERTVKNHLSNVFRKIDCKDRTQAAVFCIRNGLVSVHN